MTHRKNSWDEWEDEQEDYAEVGTSSPTSRKMFSDDRSVSALCSNENNRGHTDSADHEFACWTWDTEAMQNELESLTKSSSLDIKKNMITTLSQAENDTVPDCVRAMKLIEATDAINFQCVRENLFAWRSISLVLHWHLIQIKQCIDKGESSRHKITLLESKLNGILFPATTENDMDERVFPAHRKLQEALSSHDLAAYFEKLKRTFDRKTLTMCNDWFEPGKKIKEKERRSADSLYLQKIDMLYRVNGRLNQLTESELFQDSKDIQRDSIQINGEIALGTQGYDAIVAQIQRVLERLLSKVLPKCSQKMKNRTTSMAREILHACNRTESGGFSYEMLSRFLTNHCTQHIICRPDSSKAEPLSVEIKLGGFHSHMEEENLLKQCSFGVQVLCSALTRYSICKSDDPTCALYSLAATYKRELLFPCKITPFCPNDIFAQSVASVELELIQVASAAVQEKFR